MKRSPLPPCHQYIHANPDKSGRNGPDKSGRNGWLYRSGGFDPNQSADGHEQRDEQP